MANCKAEKHEVSRNSVNTEMCGTYITNLYSLLITLITPVHNS